MDPARSDDRTALAEGREALRRHAWREACEQLRDADGLTGEDLEGLAQAEWWTGQMGRSIEAAERAFAAHLGTDDKVGAARVAVRLSKDNFQKGASAVGTAWLHRAEKLLGEEPETVEHGYLARLKSVLAFEGRGDISEGLSHAQTALEIGAKFGDSDLQALALHDRGRMLVDAGQVAEGMALMDEATAAAVSGEFEPLTTGVIYCNTIVACEHVADYVRAGEWTEAAKRWCERQAISGFPGLCRVHRAGILRLRGAWSEAEQEARTACAELYEFSPVYAAEAFYEIGELRLRIGDLAGADEAFRQALELGREPQPGLALLRLAQERLDAAVSCIERALTNEKREVVRARLLPARVEIAVAASDVDAAAEAAAELSALAVRYGTSAFEAMAESAHGAVAHARGDTAAAVVHLRHAAQLWQRIDAPYETACARLALGRAYRAERDDQAALEQLQAAKSVFERLGAVPDERRADAMLDARDAAVERALRTFMFTDICKSTNLLEAVGDEAWRDLLRWHDETLRTLITRHRGEEVKQTGDGFFVAFRNPANAVDCARAIQRALSEHRRSHGFAPQIRIGLHATAADREGGDYRGKGVHEAARIGALAGAGEIIASRATLEASGTPASEPRAVTLKGIVGEVEVAAVDWH